MPALVKFAPFSSHTHKRNVSRITTVCKHRGYHLAVLLLVSPTIPLPENKHGSHLEDINLSTRPFCQEVQVVNRVGRRRSSASPTPPNPSLHLLVLLSGVHMRVIAKHRHTQTHKRVF